MSGACIRPLLRTALPALVSLIALLGAEACGTSGGSSDPGTLDAGKRDSGAQVIPEEDAATLPDSAPKDVAGLLLPILAKYDLPALSALVLRGNNVVAQGAVGVRELGTTTKVTTDDRFHLGGTTQTFVATVAAMVVEDGRITWSTTLGAALPDVPMHAFYKNVTLGDLLAQQGGAPRVFPAAVLRSARPPGDPRALRDEAARTLVALEPEVSLGTFNESDPSFLLATVMLERVTRTSWEQLTSDRLLGPLQMTTCGTVPSDLGPLPTVPWGHHISDGVATPIWPGSVDEPPPSLAPALGIRCSLADWGKLVAVHLAGARGERTMLLLPPSFEELQRPVDATHARGWYAVSRSWAGQALALNYASRDPGARALVWVLPSKNVALLVAVNQGGKAAENAADEAVSALVGAFVGNQ